METDAFGTCPRCGETLRPRDHKYLRHLAKMSGGACGQTFRVEKVVAVTATTEDEHDADMVKKVGCACSDPEFCGRSPRKSAVRQGVDES